MEGSGLVAKKTLIVFDEQCKRLRVITAKRRMLVTGITILCFTLVMVLIHSKTFEDKAIIQEISKRNWLSELFGLPPPPDPANTTTMATSKVPVSTTNAPVTEDPFDSWLDSLFESGPDQNMTSPKDDEAIATSSTTEVKSTTTGSTSASTETPDISTTTTTTISTTTTTTTTSTTESTPKSYSSPSPETSTTTEATTLPFCAEPNIRLSEICIIPDQIQQQQNFNITYQDFVNAVKSDNVVTFWEECKHDDHCTPDVDVSNVVNGLAETWVNGNSNAQLCPWIDCIEFINQTVDFCMKDKEQILNMTKMMCSFDFHMNKEDRKCASDVIGMLNRNMADERENNPNISMGRCHDNFSPCQADCKKQYEDMMTIFDVSCLKYATSLTEFFPWHWFSKHKTVIKASCKIETGALVEDSKDHGFNYYDELIKDKGLVAGIVLSCVVTLIAILILSAVFVKRVRRGKYYNRDGVEYSEVTGLMAEVEEPEKHHF